MKKLLIIFLLFSCNDTEEVRNQTGPVGIKQEVKLPEVAKVSANCLDSCYWPLEGTAIQTDNVNIDGGGNYFGWTSDGPNSSIGFSATDGAKTASIAISHDQVTHQFTIPGTNVFLDMGANVGTGYNGMAIQADEFELLVGGGRLAMAGGSVIMAFNDNINFISGTNGDFKTNTNIEITAQGRGIKIKEGTNATMGSVTLTGGTATVSTTRVTANSRIMLTHQNSSGVPGFVIVSARTAGASFTITSSSATDASLIAWLILQPVP